MIFWGIFTQKLTFFCLKIVPYAKGIFFLDLWHTQNEKVRFRTLYNTKMWAMNKNLTSKTASKVAPF